MPGTALWNLGFRPFFLMAGSFAALGILLWIAQLAGLTGTGIYAGPQWHAHEMIFGYAFAVIVGFLFTAVRNWTGRPTPSGRTLMGIAAVWLAGRVLALTPWYALAAVTDAIFAIAAAAGIAVPLLKSGNRRNYFFVVLLIGLGMADFAFWLGFSGMIAIDVNRWLRVALDLVLFVMVVVGGRVIPMFTGNAVAGASPKRVPWLEKIALGSVIAMIGADAAVLPGSALAALAGVAAVAHAARLLLWQPWGTLARPILWILHASYGWIVAHLALRCLAAVDLVPTSIAAHALTVGAIGGLTLGMMTRVARGHTGLPLATSTAELLAYAGIQLAAFSRVFVPLIMPQWHLAAVVGSGLAWSAAFTIFTVAFWPVLVRPRVDGRFG